MKETDKIPELIFIIFLISVVVCMFVIPNHPLLVGIFCLIAAIWGTARKMSLLAVGIWVVNAFVWFMNYAVHLKNLI